MTRSPPHYSGVFNLLHVQSDLTCSEKKKKPFCVQYTECPSCTLSLHCPPNQPALSPFHFSLSVFLFGTDWCSHVEAVTEMFIRERITKSLEAFHGNTTGLVNQFKPQSYSVWVTASRKCPAPECVCVRALVQLSLWGPYFSSKPSEWGHLLKLRTYWPVLLYKAVWG